MIKKCTKCLIEKDIEEFCVVKKNRDGRSYKCKFCRNAETSEWRKREGSAEKISSNMKKWKLKNPERMRQLKKNYRDRDPERARAIVKKCYEKNKEKYKPQQWRQAMKRLYGLSPEEFYLLQEKQNNLCAICGLPERDVRRQKLCVDHCHDTKNVRGLLCFSCNVILGNARDNPEILLKAAEYLIKSRLTTGTKRDSIELEG